MKIRCLIIVAGLVLLICGELMKPWIYIDEMSSRKISLGYHPIWDKPQLKSSDEMRQMFGMDKEARMQLFAVKPYALKLDLQRSALLAFMLASWIFIRPVSLFRAVLVSIIVGIGVFLAFLAVQA